ncbi:MAG: 5-(carboxyamino)imidazole ribonucleotide synthase [Solirubrobacteraceae bacterium]
MKIGILGGGQLGRMFIQNALNYGAEINILDPDINCPCSKICNEFTQGNLLDFDTVFSFGKNQDIISIEIEHVNIEALKELKKLNKKIIPDPFILEIIQDKGLQKKFFLANNIPTAPFSLIQYSSEIHNHIELLPAFQKVRKGGYDGKGVIKIESIKDIDLAFEEKSVLEKMADVNKEISIIVVKNDFETLTFPIVEMVVNEKLNQLDYLISPSSIDYDSIEQAEEIAKNVANALNSPGIFAIEMFYNNDKTIWVNEIAPRVHNSGHATIEGNITSQFDQMFRVLMNYPLGKTNAKNISAIVNLVGEEGYNGLVYYKGIEKVLEIPNTYIHLYGKNITKPGRKMGHITLIGKNVDDLIETIKFIKENFKVISK